jgi:excisionase family DNA binding protein
MSLDDDRPVSAAPADALEPDESRTPAEFAEEEWLTVEQAARRLNCPAAQVRDWIAGGQLTAEATGSIERVRRTEIDRLGNPTHSGAVEFENRHQSN